VFRVLFVTSYFAILHLLKQKRWVGECICLSQTQLKLAFWKALCTKIGGMYISRELWPCLSFLLVFYCSFIYTAFLNSIKCNHQVKCKQSKEFNMQFFFYLASQCLCSKFSLWVCLCTSSLKIIQTKPLKQLF
jgi:hypothetical protein